MGPNDSAAERHGRKAVQSSIPGPGNLGDVGTPGHGGALRDSGSRVSLTVRGSL